MPPHIFKEQLKRVGEMLLAELDFIFANSVGITPFTVKNIL